MLYENRMNPGEGRFPFAAAVMEGKNPFMTHCHREMEILVIRRGQLNIQYEDVPHVLEEGSVWIVPPFGSHSIEGGTENSEGEGANCERLAILLDLEIMGWIKSEDERAEIQELLNSKALYSGLWEERTRREALRLTEAMYDEYVRQEAGWHLAIKTLLNGLMLLVVRDMPKLSRKRTQKQVSKVKDILEYAALHYCEDISLGECAAQVGFNPSYLSRYFHKNLGITFQEYIKRLRIDRAKWLLGSDQMSVTEIAYASGFRDIRTFNKIFKMECGMSPSQYRKGDKKEDIL